MTTLKSTAQSQAHNLGAREERAAVRRFIKKIAAEYADGGCAARALTLLSEKLKKREHLTQIRKGGFGRK